MSEKAKPCLVSCSVLKEEIERLVEQGDLDVEMVFVSKYFHVDYAQLEQNLRKVVKKSLSRFPGRTIVVYGDLCLGQNDEMKKLTEEYDVVKVDALNCIDCILGGKGKSLDTDPNHEHLFLYPGMIGFFGHFKEKARLENVDDKSFKKLFNGLAGIILLDTLGEPEKDEKEAERLNTGLSILETRTIGLDNLKQVISEAIERNKRKTAKKRCTASS